MSGGDLQIDYAAARGSNAGDIFHELWAARHALRLLDPSSDLQAITVEGLTVKEGKDSLWDGVDCCLMYGGRSIGDANRVEIQQLKYSPSDPSSPWTLSRVCKGKRGGVSGALIRRLAEAYKGLLRIRGRDASATIEIALISNQPVDPTLIELVRTVPERVPSEYTKSWSVGKPDLHRLVHASGLGAEDFSLFAKSLRFEGDSESRFALAEGILSELARWSDAELVEASVRIREFMRKRMLPEAAGEVVTKESVLLHLGVSDDYAIFPCPPRLASATAPVPRQIASDVVSLMAGGRQHICLHGVGGSGKTTAMTQIQEGLPDGSVMVTYDCYGAGSYLDASALRHRVQDAFVQLTNEIACRLRLPFMLVPTATRDFSRAFRKRLLAAADALSIEHPNALLVVAVDAADNSIHAAKSRTPQEHSFVHDLVTFSDLPPNVRLLISARTGRIEELLLPGNFVLVNLHRFTRDETGKNVARFWNAPSDWADDFHHLSNGLPRVQAYAFEAAADGPASAVDALRPVGKDLDQVFQDQMTLAMSKSASTLEISTICAGLVALPRPVPLSDLACVLGINDASVRDVCADLAPGVRSNGDELSFADEDFEDFVRQRAYSALQPVLVKAAKYLLLRASTDSYAALNVAPLLANAGLKRQLLELVEAEPEPSIKAIPDPIRRREAHFQRLQAAITVCRETGESSRALRIVLIGAEAMKTEAATMGLLLENPGLTAKFARSTATRLILGDPDRVSAHGPLLFRLLAEDAHDGDFISTRDTRRRLLAWEYARRDDYLEKRKKNEYADPWPISADDIACAVYSRAIVDGPEEAVALIARVPARERAYLATRKFIGRLLAEGRLDTLEGIAERAAAWQAPFVLVPIALAGGAIDHQRLLKGLAALMRRAPSKLPLMARDEHQLGAWVIDTVLNAAEILARESGARQAVLWAIKPFLSVEIRRKDKVNEYQDVLIDAILRSVTLRDVLSAEVTEDVLVLPPSELEEPRNGRPSRRYDSEHARLLDDLVAAFLPIYRSRASLLLTQKADTQLVEKLVQSKARLVSESWSLSRRRGTFELRCRAAESLTVLLSVGVPASNILSFGLELARGWHSHRLGQFFSRLSAVPAVHDKLVKGVSEAAQRTRQERISAEERANTLASYASLIADVSSPDAEAIFRWAVEVAAELDSEVADQLRVVGSLVDASTPEIDDDLRPLAAKLTDVVRDSGQRLSDYDGFPWRCAMGAISRLDLHCALAASSRWDDAEVVNVSRTLGAVVEVGLRTHQLTVPQAASLVTLVTDVADRDVRLICEHAGVVSVELADRVVEEFARDAQTGRTETGASLRDYGSSSSGPWLASYIDQRERQASAAPTDAPDECDSGKDGESREVELGTWTTQQLTDPLLLRDAVAKTMAKHRDVGRYSSYVEVLGLLAKQVMVRHRVEHLQALAFDDGEWQGHYYLRALFERLEQWGSGPAVKEWKAANLSALVSSRLPDLCHYLPHQDTDLMAAIAQLKEIGANVCDVLLGGIEENIDALSAGTTFAIASAISSNLDAAKASSVRDWYIERLFGRLDDADREDVPYALDRSNIADSVARFIYASMSDVDVRTRWRGGHALRRLARLEDGATVHSVVLQYLRGAEPEFREVGAPFYWLSARLWLVMAIDRVCLESPVVAATHFDWLYDVATDEAFPHVIIRDFARDAALKLLDGRHIERPDCFRQSLGEVNRSQLKKSKRERDYSRSFDAFNHYETQRRFNFDGLDTLRYWYDPLLQVFSDVTPEEFLREAEVWIVDQWGTSEEPKSRSLEPRKQRFNERTWSLSSNSHGSMPTLEDHRTYLQWHAMWCTVGSLMRHRKLAKSRYSEDELTEQVSRSKLTCPPVWLADVTRGRPLQGSRWLPRDLDSSVSWMDGVQDQEFLLEVLAEDESDYVVVAAYIEDGFSKNYQTTRISSAMVTPETALSLVRALQTVRYSHDFYVCPEGHDAEISENGFRLSGWLRSNDGDPRLDQKDPFSNGVRRIEFSPGPSVEKALGLSARFEHGIAWHREGSLNPTFMYQAWGNQEDPLGRYSSYERDIRPSGYRLLISKTDLAEYLSKKKRDLILEVEITRREYRMGRSGYGEEEQKENEFERILLFRQDGTVEAAERDLGSWRQAST